MDFKKRLDQMKKELSKEREILDFSLENQKKLFLEKTVEVFTENDLTEKLRESIKNKKPLRIKYGVDPTSSKFHLGHYTFFKRFRTLQKFGHQIIFLIGDFTATIGDPSDKEATRKPLTEKEVKKNLKGLKKQIGKILDLEKTEIVYNSRWLKKMSLNEFLPLTSLITVSRMLERENFAKRFKENKPISIREFLYPFFQAYDSVKLKADIEIGGTDQTFNMLAGREIQKAFGQKAQAVLTLPLLLGTDGLKMSKTTGNCIFLTDKPKDIFGKIMSVPDALLKDYFSLLTDLSLSDWQEIEAAMRKGFNPKKVKEVLAFILTARLYNPKIAEREEVRFNRLFSRKKIQKEDLEELTAVPPKKLLDLLYENKFIKSKMEGRRLFRGGAIKLVDKEQVVISNPDYLIKRSGEIFKIGKKIFIKVIFKQNA